MPEARWLAHRNVVKGMQRLVGRVRWQINHGVVHSCVRLIGEQPV